MFKDKGCHGSPGRCHGCCLSRSVSRSSGHGCSVVATAAAVVVVAIPVFIVIVIDQKTMFAIGGQLQSMRLTKLKTNAHDAPSADLVSMTTSAGLPFPMCYPSIFWRCYTLMNHLDHWHLVPKSMFPGKLLIAPTRPFHKNWQVFGSGFTFVLPRLPTRIRRDVVVHLPHRHPLCCFACAWVRPNTMCL